MFRVGQTVRADKNYTISRIERNDNHWFDYKTVVYEIYGKDDKGVEELLKIAENQPVYISFSNEQYKDN